MTSKTSKPRNRRITIGEWSVPYDDAPETVVIERSLGDILGATPGNDLECMNSRCIRAQRNERAFPHPVFVVSTTASRVYIVDRLDDSGQPAHAVRYELGKRAMREIRSHDRDGTAQPGELRLDVPREPKGSQRRATRAGRTSHRENRKQNAGTGPQAQVVGTAIPSGLNGPRGSQRRYVVAVGAATRD